MALPLLEMEGTWEEIAAAASARFNGERLRVLVMPAPMPQTEKEPVQKETRQIEEVLAELAASIPQEEWEKFPPDFTDQLDHYIYGTPKR